MVLIGKATSENPGLRGPLAAPRVGFLCSLIILVSYFWRGADAPHTAALSAVESYRALMHMRSCKGGFYMDTLQDDSVS